MKRAILGLAILIIIIISMVVYLNSQNNESPTSTEQNKTSGAAQESAENNTTTTTTNPATQTGTETQQSDICCTSHPETPPLQTGTETQQPEENNETQPSTPKTRNITIGLTVSLTGRLQEEGIQYLCGALATTLYINSNGGITIEGQQYNLTLVYYDDASNKDRIPMLYERLVEEDGVDFLLGPYSTALSLVAAPLADHYGIPMVIAGSISDGMFNLGYTNIVQILTPTTKYFDGALRLVSMYVPDPKIAIIYENSYAFVKMAEGARQTAESLGLPIVYEASYERGATDLEPYIESGKNSGANVLIAAGYYETSQNLLRLAHDMGWRLKFIAAIVAPSYPEFPSLVGEQVALGVASVTQWIPGSYHTPERTPTGYEWYGPTYHEWLSYFNKAKNTYPVCRNLDEPTYRSAAAGAGILFLAKAIEEAQTLDPSAVRQAMNTISIYTFFGKLRIDPETGKQVGHELLVTQWQTIDGQLRNVVIYPGHVAENTPLIAPPNWWS